MLKQLISSVSVLVQGVFMPIRSSSFLPLKQLFNSDAEKEKYAPMHIPKHNDPNDFQRLLNIETAQKLVNNTLMIAYLFGAGLVLQGIVIFLLTKTFDFLSIAEIGFVFGISYGISRYNKICIRLLFGYMVITTILMIARFKFGAYGLYIRGYLVHCLWLGMFAIENYHQLMRNDRVAAAIAYENQVAAQAEEHQSSPEPSSAQQPLRPTAELISLCEGDTNQAQWLLAKMKRKNPEQSVEWCNEQVIEQLVSRSS
jgi:hypothetical protein